jgi:hypothetical protein
MNRKESGKTNSTILILIDLQKLYNIGNYQIKRWRI